MWPSAGSRLDILDAGDPDTSVRAVFSWSTQKLSDPAARMFPAAERASGLINMGVALRAQGRYADALSQARQALHLYRTANYSAGQAGALNNIGLYHIHLGSYQAAVACCQEALTGFRQIDNRHGAAHALDSLGYAYHFLGQSARAIACYQKSLDAFREHGDQRSEADTLAHLGDTLYATGKPQAARHAWQAALRILSELHHPDVAGSGPSSPISVTGQCHQRWFDT